MNTRRSLTVYSLNKIGYSIILIGRPVPSTCYSMAVPDRKKSVRSFDSSIRRLFSISPGGFYFFRWIW